LIALQNFQGNNPDFYGGWAAARLGEVRRNMATTTGGTALAARPTDSAWLASLPNNPLPNNPLPNNPLPKHRHATVSSDTLPAVPLHRVSRLAEGALTGLPGAVTELGVSRDGRHLVAAHYGADAASVIDTATLTVATTVPGIAEPYAVATADRAYLRSASIWEDGVVAVDLESGAALAARKVGVGAGGLAVGPAGEALYVARSADDVADIAVIDVESGTVTAIPVIAAPGAAIDAVRINGAGTRLYAALSTAAGGALVVIEIRTGRVQFISVGAAITDIAVHGDDRRAFVTGWDPAQGAVLHVVDTSSARVLATTPVDGVPVGIIAGEAAVYLAHGEQVSVFDAHTVRLSSNVDVGKPVSCLAVSRDGTRVYVGDYEGGITALAVQALSKGLRAAS
jgi:YVTN family beta-propeller protein